MTPADECAGVRYLVDDVSAATTSIPATSASPCIPISPLRSPT